MREQLKKYNIIKPELFIFLLLLIITTFVSIAGGIGLFFCYLFLYKNSYNKWSFVFVSYIYAIISFTQFSTIDTTDYDLIRYYSRYQIFSELSLNEGLQAIFIHGDIFFYSIVFFLSKLVPSDPRVLSLFFTFTISTLLFFAIDNFVFKYSKKNRYNLLSIILWIISFFLISSFINLTNAYRQFFAISLFLFGLSRKELNKKYIIYFLLAALSHWSIIIYLLLYFITNKFKNKSNYILILVPFFSLIINMLLPRLNLSDRVNSYLFGEEILGVDKTILIITILVQGGIIYVLSKYRDRVSTLYVLGVLSISYNVIFILNSTIIIRHFFFLGFLFTIILLVLNSLDSQLFKNNRQRLKLDLILILFFFYNIKSLILGGSTYLILEDNSMFKSFISFLTSPFPHEIIS